MFICALSGESAKDPVVSPKSGSIFERSLVESYISTLGKDPVNDEPLTVEELISIQTKLPVAAPPRPPAFNSIPTMLSAFQNEWDALALETYTLRKQLHSARQELSEALYQYDAAVRVAAKAIRERDEARQALEKLSETFASEAGKIDEDNGSNGNHNGGEEKVYTKETIPAELLTSLRDELFALHKKEKLLLALTKQLTVDITFEETSTQVTDISGVSANDDGSIAARVSEDKVETIPDGKLHDVPGVSAAGIVSGQTLAIGNGTITNLLENSTSNLPLENVTLVIPHPTQSLFVALTSQNEWALVSSGENTELLYKSQIDTEISTGALHVDGVLLGLGTTAREVLILDLTTTETVSTITTKYAKVDKIQFARNGYWLVVASSEKEQAALQIFDLRKNTVVHELEVASHIDFVLDPSSQVLTTYNYSESKLAVHLYAKKGKLWVDNAAELTVENLLFIYNETSPDGLKADSVVRVAGISAGKTHHFALEFK